MANILITGCTSGLGFDCALRLAMNGDHVIAAARQPARAADLRNACKQHDVAVDIVELDVTDPASVARGVDQAIELVGSIDVLVNNAGTLIAGAIEDTADDETYDVFNTNVFGLLRVTRAVLPHFRAQGRGVVVNVSSIGGFWSLPFRSIYGASKHAVEAISDGLRREVEPFGIRVAVVQPGSLSTRLADNARRARGSEQAVYTDREAAFFDALALFQERLGVTRDVADATDAVLDAIHGAAPRRSYRVGADAELLGALRGMADDEAFDRVVNQLLFGP